MYKGPTADYHCYLIEREKIGSNVLNNIEYKVDLFALNKKASSFYGCFNGCYKAKIDVRIGSDIVRYAYDFAETVDQQKPIVRVPAGSQTAESFKSVSNIEVIEE